MSSYPAANCTAIESTVDRTDFAADEPSKSPAKSIAKLSALYPADCESDDATVESTIGSAIFRSYGAAQCSTIGTAVEPTVESAHSLPNSTTIDTADDIPFPATKCATNYGAFAAAFKLPITATHGPPIGTTVVRANQPYGPANETADNAAKRRTVQPTHSAAFQSTISDAHTTAHIDSQYPTYLPAVGCSLLPALGRANGRAYIATRCSTFKHAFATATRCTVRATHNAAQYSTVFSTEYFTYYSTFEPSKCCSVDNNTHSLTLWITF